MAREIKIKLALEAGAQANIESQINSIKGKAKVALELDASEITKIRNQLLTGDKAKIPVQFKLAKGEKSKIKNDITTAFKEAIKVRIEPENLNALKADTISSQIGTITIKKIDASKAISGVKKQLQEMMNALTVMPAGGTGGLAAFIGSDAIGSVGGKATSMEQVVESINKSKEATDRYAGSIKALKTETAEASKVYKKARAFLSGEELEKAAQTHKLLQGTTEVLSGKKLGKQYEIDSQISELHAFSAEMNNVISTHTEAATRWKAQVDVLNKTFKSADSAFVAANKHLVGTKDLDKVTAEYSRLKDVQATLSSKDFGDQKEIMKATSEVQKYAAAVNKAVEAEKQKTAETKKGFVPMERVAKLNASIQKTLSENTKMKGTVYASDLNSLMASLSGGAVTPADFAKINQQYQNVLKNASAAGKMGRSFGSQLRTVYDRLLAYGMLSTVFYRVASGMKDIYNNVVEIDTAMTQLRKVTDETNSTYDKFFDGVDDRAKSIGATMSDTINASADFARLGYDIDTASKMADAALVYKNVGDNITDISQASESLTSTIQAFKEFGIEATDAMEVVDRFNEVGKQHCPAA